MPAWLQRFRPEDWPGADYIARRREWSRAGHQWLREHDQPGSDWFVLAHLDSAANCGLRLRGDYGGGTP